eukprot:3214940-Rhodomonas_salina.1
MESQSMSATTEEWKPVSPAREEAPRRGTAKRHREEAPREKGREERRREEKRREETRRAHHSQLQHASSLSTHARSLRCGCLWLVAGKGAHRRRGGKERPTLHSTAAQPADTQRVRRGVMLGRTAASGSRTACMYTARERNICVRSKHRSQLAENGGGP